MATQSGFQVIYGGGSLSEDMTSMASDSSSEEGASAEDLMGFSPLTALALIAVIGGVAFTLIAIFKGGFRADVLSSLLATLALVFLVIQMVIGFPAKKHMAESMSGGGSEAQPRGEGFGHTMGSSMASAIMSSIQVKTTSIFYLELIVLGIPSLLLANTFIDKYKKDV